MKRKLTLSFFCIVGIAAIIWSFSGCSGSSGDYQFELLRKGDTGLDFENVLRQSSEFNVFNYMYFFNGGGLAAGDFNNDGLVDLFFTSNMGPNKLFLNQGGLKFRDVTAEAGMEGMEGWTSGASVVDINNDGLLDIYVSQMGEFQNITGQNQFYICEGIKDGIPVYEDRAVQYNLDLVGFSTQAVFFDYDLDGDLDMYQLNHSLHANGTFGQKKEFLNTRHPLAGDKLMRNDGDTFTDVTLAAGINSTVIGYGLGVVTGDINLDGWPDIYVCNDFHENDYLYINQKDGTFKEDLTNQMMHTSRFSMGVDMADINNDGFDEVASLDMLPSDPYILKTSLGEDDYALFHFKLGYGYNQQFARNNLQLNNGDGTFSEIGIFAGVFATDWSWAPLFMDFDHDGYKDLFISNGIPRRMNDIDYVNFRADNAIRYKANTNNLEEADLVVVEKMPRIKLPNKFFRNTGSLRFQDMEKAIKGSLPTFSNGAIYADLDNDGDLDVVVNNIEDEPFVYRNLEADNNKQGHSYLSLRLQGPSQNINAIGASVAVFKGKEKLYYQNFPGRGYQSSVQSGLNIGIGDSSLVDSIIVIWPDLSYQKFASLPYNQIVELKWEPGLPAFDYKMLSAKPPATWEVEDATQSVGLDYVHKENPFVEFNREGLIPHMVSTEGPALAVGDVNGDGLEDMFVGSSKREYSRLFLQTEGGKFEERKVPDMEDDSLFEDVDAVFADLENDGDLDLVVASGGNEYWGEHEALKQRAYINDGKGNFAVNKDIFPGAFLTASCVLSADFNGDGLVDFFFGGRAVPWNYGKAPTSYLFENKGNGRFENVTAKVADGLEKVGLVKSGTWSDIDQDGDPDLILAMEWGPIQFFLNDGGTLKNHPLNDMKGWWNFVLPYDFDQDGDIDILAGNLGDNSKLKPTPEEPVRLYVNDFDDNEQVEQVLTYYLDGNEVPFANYKEITKQMVGLKKKYLFAKDFAKASMDELFGKEKLESADVLEANTFHSMYFENTGGLNFVAHPLPDELQFSTLNAAGLYDFDGDGSQDVLLGGNFYENNIELGRYDANYGSVLKIGPDGSFSVGHLGSLRIKGQVRRVKAITIGGKFYFIIIRNDGPAMVVQPKPSGKKLLSSVQ